MSVNGRPPGIPRVIHRIWLGGPELEWTAAFAETWRTPGWDLIQWDEGGVDSLFPLRNQAIYDAAPEIVPDHVGQLRSDVLRLEILHRFGGVYVDCDLERLAPLDPLLIGAECFAAWEVQGEVVNNAILGTVAGHPFFEHLIDGLSGSVKGNAGYKPNRMSGPRYLTEVYRRHGEGVTVFPQKLFYPYGFAEIANHGPGEVWPDAVACHHWANRRRERGVPV